MKGMDTKHLKINSSHLVLMANVKDAPFKCTTCRKVFISEAHLNRHKERRHNLRDHSVGDKGECLNESMTTATIQTVLNATERIEDLLFKLTSVPKSSDPLDCSSGVKHFKEESIMNIDYRSESGSFTVNDVRASIDEVPIENPKQLMDIKYYDFLDEKENEALCRLTTVKAIDSLQIDQKNDIQDQFHESRKSDTISSNETFTDGESFIDYRKKLKEEVIRKLNMKLESFGVDCNQDRVSDIEIINIGKLLQKERDQVAEESPEYYKLRNLINDSAERRIRDNLKNKSVLIS